MKLILWTYTSCNLFNGLSVVIIINNGLIIVNLQQIAVQEIEDDSVQLTYCVTYCVTDEAEGWYNPFF